jgi:hypothetical protein
MLLNFSDLPRTGIYNAPNRSVYDQRPHVKIEQHPKLPKQQIVSRNFSHKPMKKRNKMPQCWVDTKYSNDDEISNGAWMCQECNV